MTEFYDFATQKDSISGCFSKNHELHLRLLPDYIQEFPNVIQGVKLKWHKCKFVVASQQIVPDKHGVYCFSIEIGHPLPNDIHIPLYIGKAAPGYLSERFRNYFKERSDEKGRQKLVHVLNRHRNDLFFWWSELPRVYVDTVEEHLLMCCQPPCNSNFPRHERLWGKAFD